MSSHFRTVFFIIAHPQWFAFWSSFAFSNSHFQKVILLGLIFVSSSSSFLRLLQIGVFPHQLSSSLFWFIIWIQQSQRHLLVPLQQTKTAIMVKEVNAETLKVVLDSWEGLKSQDDYEKVAGNKVMKL